MFSKCNKCLLRETFTQDTLIPSGRENGSKTKSSRETQFYIDIPVFIDLHGEVSTFESQENADNTNFTSLLEGNNQYRTTASNVQGE